MSGTEPRHGLTTRLVGLVISALALGSLSAATWAPRTDAALQTDLKAACEQAAAATPAKPVLVEFSAPWCGDCVLLHRLDDEPVLQAALDKVQRLTIDVGRFDRHKPLLEYFGVGSIAHWELLSSSNCAAPVTKWRRIAHSTLEPAHGSTGPRTAEQIASWLDTHTAQAAAATPAK